MTLEEAIQTALEYETKIRDIYFEGARAVEAEAGRRIFQTLGEDEQKHIDFLNHKLRQWQATGRIVPERLESAVPPAEVIARQMAKLEAQMAREDRGVRQQMLSKALQMEIATSQFYRKMVQELSGEGQQMFARFLEIEDAHINAVQFELDYISKTGYWLDFKEFDME
ncbi:MAG: hypothetical protein JSW39_02550 [Desulfobacterales bacterium]|nr:MAG: hypothetical protein JSW39_02550 [Desulfobacterales bacterium]